MKKILLTLSMLLLCAASILTGCSGDTTDVDDSPSVENNSIEITDSLGRTVTIPADADSFIAVGPGCLRLYCYVGDVSKIVGIEQLEVTNGDTGRPYAKANPSLLELPIIGPGGPGNAPDPEKILEVAPDVIFSMYNADAASVDELYAKTNIPVVALSYGATEVFDPLVDASLEIIGKVTGRESRAAEVIAFFAECKEDLDSRTNDIAEDGKPGVYLGAQSNRGTHGIESTNGDFSLFTAVNARNVVGEAGVEGYVMLDKEMLLEMDPDIIVIDAAGLANVQADYAENTEFYNGLTAFKNNNVYIQMPYNYYYTNIDIALCDAYYIGSIVYPEQFDDINIFTRSDEIFRELLGAELYEKVAEEYYGGFQNITFD